MYCMLKIGQTVNVFQKLLGIITYRLTVMLQFSSFLLPLLNLVLTQLNCAILCLLTLLLLVYISAVITASGEHPIYWLRCASILFHNSFRSKNMHVLVLSKILFFPNLGTYLILRLFHLFSVYCRSPTGTRHICCTNILIVYIRTGSCGSLGVAALSRRCAGNVIRQCGAQSGGEVTVEEDRQRATQPPGKSVLFRMLVNNLVSAPHCTDTFMRFRSGFLGSNNLIF